MKKRYIYFLILSLFIVLSFVSLVGYSHTFHYDNNVSMFGVVNHRYAKEKINKLEECISFSNMYVDYPFWKFNLEYRPECIRKTPFGYYAVLIHEDDSLCFVFWTFENKIYSIYRTKGFVSSAEFENSIIIGETTFSDMKKSGLDFFGYPYSKIIATAHICTDGIIVIDYDDSFVAKSLRFFSNEELTLTNDDFLKIVPYILPKDKNDKRSTGDGSVSYNEKS